MAESKTPSSESSPASEAKVHIVYTEKPEDQEPEEQHLKFLSSVLGRFILFLFLNFCIFIAILIVQFVDF